MKYKKGQIISNKKDLKGIYLETIHVDENYSMISLFNFKTMQIEEWEKDLTLKVRWKNISWHQKLTEAFIEKYQDQINWRSISCYQKLSESFIEKFQNKVEWVYISHFQKLSESFKKKWKHKLNY